MLHGATQPSHVSGLELPPSSILCFIYPWKNTVIGKLPVLLCHALSQVSLAQAPVLSGSIVPLVPFLPASQAPRTSQPLSAPQTPDIKKKNSKKQPGGGAGIDFRQDVPDLFFSISVIRKAVGL